METEDPTYDVVTLGEVYKGIDVKLKIYGNKVEERFRIRPKTSPDQVKIWLDGARARMASKNGLLETGVGQGTVKFTKPIAYQEIDGKRVEVDCKYVIRDREPLSAEYSKQTATKKRHAQREQPMDTDNGNTSRTYGFKVGSYDKTKDLIICHILVSSHPAGHDGDWCYSLALDTNENLYVAGSAWSTDFPATSRIYDTSSNEWADGFASRLNGNLSPADSVMDCSISGTIYQSDGVTPITDADIGIEVYQGDPCSGNSYVASGYTSNGVYTVYGLPPGTYSVCTWDYQSNYLDEWWADSGSVYHCDEAGFIEITSGSINGKNSNWINIQIPLLTVGEWRKCSCRKES